MKADRWRRQQSRVYQRENTDLYQAFVFSAPNWHMWAWGVWGVSQSHEGIAFNLISAKKRANAAIAQIESGEPSTERKA